MMYPHDNTIGYLNITIWKKQQLHDFGGISGSPVVTVPVACMSRDPVVPSELVTLTLKVSTSSCPS